MVERYDKLLRSISFFLACDCGETRAAGASSISCPCGGAWSVDYDWPALARSWRPDHLKFSVESLWRYAPVLPADPINSVTLREGCTPQLRAHSLGEALELDDLWIKDEGRNPTGSWEARGASIAVSVAKAAGAHRLCMGANASGATALGAYAAAAGLPAQIYVPFDTPRISLTECLAYGASVIPACGRLSECMRKASQEALQVDGFDLSAPNEPYRLEGDKTVGYEIAEQFGWQLPDVILCPWGAGAILAAMWKAFAELEKLTWIGPQRPRLVAVQTSISAAGTALRARLEKAIVESSGISLSVSPEEAMDGALLLAGKEGILAAPESGACIAALERLLKTGFLQSRDKIIVINSASGLRSPEKYATRFPHHRGGEQDKLGGLITPR